ncbi:hypothetical protein BST83_09955 [Polaribacter filamentus]|uniref:Uncharacterized protein n=1 Tax=Polaribacter filamentus TaxID=53483 RepID=A0A2S7KXV3_9FLAO|nr:hypothetical protein BST83_09955 [Polaribacter filamentus]
MIKQQKIKKRVVFNFDDVKEQLTDKIIDNIEGITFGHYCQMVINRYFKLLMIIFKFMVNN